MIITIPKISAVIDAIPLHQCVSVDGICKIPFFTIEEATEKCLLHLAEQVMRLCGKRTVPV